MFIFPHSEAEAGFCIVSIQDPNSVPPHHVQQDATQRKAGIKQQNSCIQYHFIHSFVGRPIHIRKDLLTSHLYARYYIDRKLQKAGPNGAHSLINEPQVSVTI